MTEIDRQQLIKRKTAFMAHSQFRLQKMLSSFGQQQADWISILPLFFHLNHPLLPGYQDSGVVAGLPDYAPDRLTVRIARGISKSFHFESKAHLRFNIEGLYLMGSTGSIGQAVRSDLDCWVVVHPDLERLQRQKLSAKCTALSQWFADKGIELNCYLVDRNSFVEDRLQKLLLDEFYRTAVWLAGRKPMWWIIDADGDHKQQVSRLMQQRHIDSSEWLDFGPVLPIKAEEFMEAALGQLLKAVDAPFKSVIKLTLLEVYASQFPQIELLSNQYKKRLLVTEKEFELLDPYYLLYQYISERLEKAARRIKFLRKCLYLKSAIKLQPQLSKNWRHQLLNKLVSQWQFSEEAIRFLNQRSQWSVPQIRKVRAELVIMLNQSYRLLSDFSKIHGIATPAVREKILSIGRQLYVAFEEKDNKICQINRGISVRRDAKEMSLCHLGEQQWLLFDGLVAGQSVDKKKPVYEAKSVTEALLWSIVNGLVSDHSLIHLDSERRYPTTTEIRELQRCLHQFCAQQLSHVETTALAQSEQTERILVVANSEWDPMQLDKREGIFQIESGDDFHCYGQHQSNYFANLEVIKLTSWGQTIIDRINGDDAIVTCYQRYMAQIDNHKADFKVLATSQPQKVATQWLRIYQQWQQKRKQADEDIPFYHIRRSGTQILLVEFASHIDCWQFPQLEPAYAAFSALSHAYHSCHLDIERWHQLDPSVVVSADEMLSPQIECYFWTGSEKFPTASGSANARLFQNQKIQHRGEAENKRSSDEMQCWHLLIKLPTGHQFWFYHQHATIEQISGHYHQFFNQQNMQVTELSPGCDWWRFRKVIDGEQEISYAELNPVFNISLADLVQLTVRIHRTTVASEVAADRTQKMRALSLGILTFNWLEQRFVVDAEQLASFQPLLSAVSQRRNGGDYPLFVSAVEFGDEQRLSMADSLYYKQAVENLLEQARQTLV